MKLKIKIKSIEGNLYTLNISLDKIQEGIKNPCGLSLLGTYHVSKQGDYHRQTLPCLERLTQHYHDTMIPTLLYFEKSTLSRAIMSMRVENHNWRAFRIMFLVCFLW